MLRSVVNARSVPARGAIAHFFGNPKRVFGNPQRDTPIGEDQREGSALPTGRHCRLAVQRSKPHRRVQQRMYWLVMRLRDRANIVFQLERGFLWE